MVVCLNCNQEINVEDHYCSYCGYPQISDDTLYHYTSLPAFERIVSDINKGNIVLRAYDAKTMNDPTDTQYLLEILSKKNVFSGKNTFDSYILSFSKLRDSLYMWNCYGDKGNGVAIGINKQKLFAVSNKIEQTFHILCKLFPCHYWSEKDISNYLQKTCNTSRNNLSDIEKDNLSYLSCLIKDPGYISECEERLTVLDGNQQYTPSGIIQQDDKKKYIEIPIPVSAIEVIVTGPCMDNNNCSKISSLLYGKPELIKSSSIKYRQNK